ncbi:MAG: S-methyl-5-thioribose-1-phosphate isomerase [Myxococcota bacterium]|nr:S-methyl-5-thioribose-1-phosphate isomerase [Myxococcota bacterium]
MKINGVQRRSITVCSDGRSIEIIDQRALPHAVVCVQLKTLDDAVRAIREMWVRGAPLIGAVAAYGVCLSLRNDTSDLGIERACRMLQATRPTAVNLQWAIDRMRTELLPIPPAQRVDLGWQRAHAICDEDVAINEAIGKNGLALLQHLLGRKSPYQRLNVLTHCNAGWLATVDWGTALAPVYMAHGQGLPVHVWVDESRPRNQGALTAWELGQHGVPHTIIVDNTGGHLMQHGMVDICIVGADRVTARGDVCNKIGTYLKALAAHDNGVPFYVAVPYPTIDWTVEDGVVSIPIEERDPSEVLEIHGAVARADDGNPPSTVSAESAALCGTVQPYGHTSHAANYAFDVTPARLVTGLITERGVVGASRDGLSSLYPEHAKV